MTRRGFGGILEQGVISMEKEIVVHTLEPVYDRASRVLLLGSMPSPKSRQAGFYYAHPQNRFWRVLAQVLGECVPETVEEKRALLLRRHVALWDVLARCEIRGADDGSIRAPEVNDFSQIFRACPIRAVFATGSAAARLYRRYCPDGRKILPLPSTSPANCRWYTFEDLVRAYEAILEFL